MNEFVNSLKQSIHNWLQSMEYEPLKYKMCKSAYDDYLLDSISLAYDLKQMINHTLTEQEKDSAKEIMDNYQNFTDGFFIEKDYSKRLSKVKIDRVIEMHANYITFQAIGAYKAINRLPKHKITFYDKFIKGKGIKKYLEENCPWGRSPWGAGGMVDNLGIILDINIKMGYKEYLLVVDEIFVWLDKNQSSDTGMWGSAKTQGINGLINGAYHLMRGTYFTYNRPFNYPEKIIDNIIKDLKTHEKFTSSNAHGCQDLDHFYLLEKCHAQIPDYRNDEVSCLSQKRLNELKTIVFCNDGAFSFETNNSVKVHNYYSLSPGKKESDMLGTTFYLQTIISIYKMLNITVNYENSKTHAS